MQKILHIITGLNVGGAENALYNLLLGGLSELFENRVVSLSTEGAFCSHIRELGIPLSSLGMKPVNIQSFIELRKIVAEFQPDVIHGWMYHGNLAAYLSLRTVTGAKPALVWNVRQCLYKLRDEKFLTRQVIRANRCFSQAPDMLLYNSNLSRQQHEAFGFCSDNGLVIPNGFDLDRLSPDPETRRRVRISLGIEENACIVGHVARFHPMKDHVLFVRAAVRLALSYEDIHVLLIGRDITQQNSLLSSLVPEHIRSRFHWLGERSDIVDLMRTMDVFCQSSWSEAFPNVLGEAMATGIPCVATNVGDSSCIIDNTGIIVPPHDENEMFNGLHAMLNKTDDERASLGKAARSRIKKKFGLKAIIGEYSKLYQNIVAG